ncbi:MAG: phosphoglucomutase/phosphomannomutase family protein, partial [Chloroflexi bacterium]|nr:phosphoglucomutase/phosphomannomutase family protein [Chloroflexota bacterium]
DADRIGAVDAAGQFVDPHAILTILLRHLVEHKGQRGAVVKSISTTGRLNVLAGRYGLPVHETPVGFNHIAALMIADNVLIGGEESGGMSIQGHIPEGDGILAGLLLLEALAISGASLAEVLAQIAAEVGHFYYQREDVAAPGLSKPALVARLLAAPPAALAGQTVASVNNSDGVKYTLADDGWLLLRPSGTEPLLRVYAEGRTPQQVSELLAAGRRLAGV